MMLAGYVCLVGAGPGAPGLVTRLGLEYLSRADVVLYDHLIPYQLLLETSPGCELIAVGKQGLPSGGPEGRDISTNQDEINTLLIGKAREGKFVVRLKGGDPFLLGRGGEEAEALKSANVPYIVVPGVSSSYAVPAYAGIPVTHRRYSSGVEVVTGHKAEGQSEITNTRVILMALSHLDNLVSQLSNEGFPKDTPACLISRGTTPEQKVVRGRLADIPSLARQVTLPTPVMLIVGNVAGLADNLAWQTNLPLLGKRILWTRPKEKDESPLLEELRLYGGEVVHLPLLNVKPVSNVKLDNMLIQARQMQWVIFTSATAVEIFFNVLLRNYWDWRYFSDTKIAVIGENTAKALREKGRNTDFIALNPTGDGLLDLLLEHGKAGDKIALCRASKTLPALANGLTEAGMDFREFELYNVECPEYPPELVINIFSVPFDFVFLGSPQTVENFFRITAETGGAVRDGTRFVCVGKETAFELEKFGFRAWFVPEKPSFDLMVKHILNQWGIK